MASIAACDVLIVGAGVAGSALAWELARLGSRVVVAERGAVGSGSSGLNAGGLRHQFSQESSIRAAARSIDHVVNFKERFGLDPCFWRAGYLFLYGDPATGRMVQASVTRQRQLGLRTRMVDREEIRQIFPGINTADVIGGSFGPDDGYADPGTVVRGFALAARAAGARIATQSPVTGFEVVGGRVTGVNTPNGRYAPDLVVNCAGCWAPQVARMYGGELPITAHRQSIFRIDGSPAPARHLPLTIDLILGLYFHSEGRGLLVGPAESVACAEPPAAVATPWEDLPMVAERLAHRLPVLAEVGVSHGWGGFVESTPDDNPILGFTHLENVYTFAGFSGHGMCIAPGLASEVAIELTGGTPELDLSVYRPARFREGGVEPEHMWGSGRNSAGVAAARR